MIFFSEVKPFESAFVFGHSRLITNGLADNQPVVRGGQLNAYAIEHVFVSALLPYANYRGSAADLLGGLSFNAVLRNLTGEGLDQYTFSLSSGLFGNLGTVTPQFGGLSDIAFNGADAIVKFSPMEFLDVEIGNPLGNGGVDWTIVGLNALDTFSITVSAVPEPETLALLLSGLGAVGWITRRRRQQA